MPLHQRLRLLRNAKAEATGIRLRPGRRWPSVYDQIWSSGAVKAMGSVYGVPVTSWPSPAAWPSPRALGTNLCGSRRSAAMSSRVIWPVADDLFTRAGRRRRGTTDDNAERRGEGRCRIGRDGPACRQQRIHCRCTGDSPERHLPMSDDSRIAANPQDLLVPGIRYDGQTLTASVQIVRDRHMHEHPAQSRSPTIRANTAGVIAAAPTSCRCIVIDAAAISSAAPHLRRSNRPVIG